MKKELYNNPGKVSELPDLIQYGLPQRLKGIRKHIKCDSVTMETFSDFFDRLCEMWGFLDYELLRYMIMMFGQDDLIKRLKDYEEKMEDFCAKTTIYELIENWDPRYAEKDIPKEFKLCVTELSWDPKNKKVKDLKDIQQKIKHALPQELGMAAFCVYHLKPGSVTVLWLVWRDCLPQVIAKLQAHLRAQPGFVTDNQISFLSIDGVILYSSYNDQVSKVFLYSSEHLRHSIRITSDKHLIIHLI